MKTNSLAFFVSILTAFSIFSCEMPQPKGDKMIPKVKPGTPIDISYPTTFKDSTIVDEYFGEKIRDPFRWLEDDHSEDTKKWVKDQNKTTQDYIAHIPYRDAIAKRLETLWNYEKFSTPFKKGDKYYYFRNSGLQNQSVLYGTNALEKDAVEIIDPNKFSSDGTSSLANFGFSKNGKYFAYGVSEGGSDWRTVYVKDLTTGELLQDKVEWVKFSGISWHKDGFFYSRYPKPKVGDDLKGQNKFHAMYYHKLGTSQAKDQMTFANRRNPKINVYGGTTEDERFLTISTTETTSNNRLYFKDLSKGDEYFTPVVENMDNDFWVIDNDGDNLLVLTNHKAPNYRLISINTEKIEEGFWEEVIPESENVLSSVTIAGGKLVANYIKDAASLLKIHSLSGEYEYDLKLPTMGTVNGFNGKKDENIAFYSFTSFTYPSTIFKYDFSTEESSIYRVPQIKGINPDDYETKQIFYESRDGTKIPMFITHKKGILLDGTNPTLLYGYGGFNISIQPSFSISRMILLENGGIYAVANIRGGGEYGKKWHDGGRLLNKQNVFDDFVAAAEYLIEEKYTSSQKLAIEGRSNGGLLVGACMTQRPDLFKVALPAVGVLDMLRYHEFTIGRAWATDYGLSSDAVQFQYLLNYSPLHNMEAGTNYPATLVTTADHDDRVVPAHSFKFIAELQRNHEGKNPVLIRVETSAGHGAGKPTKMAIEELADINSFMLYNLGEDVIYDK
ncbi:MAG: prolyl oligopeptidase [Maribacter sp.]|jgi:prolyl oligopeptidase